MPGEAGPSILTSPREPGQARTPPGPDQASDASIVPPPTTSSPR